MLLLLRSKYLLKYIKSVTKYLSVFELLEEKHPAESKRRPGVLDSVNLQMFPHTWDLLQEQSVIRTMERLLKASPLIHKATG